MARMKFTRPEKSWILYDVANSAFTMLIATTIPILFRGLAEADGVAPATVTALWSTVTSAAVLVLVLLSPILGALADYRGMKKRIFAVFLAMGLVGLFALAAATRWQAFLCFFLFARIGYAACTVFYDSMLVDVTSDERMDVVSSCGYAYGYIGSCIPFAIGIVLILLTPFGLSVTAATQISFLITGLWWAGLTIPLLRDVRQTHFLPPRSDMVRDTFRRLGRTFGKVREQKRTFLYILAYFCYIDGVYTIISLATTYGGEVGISQEHMILALLLTQIVAFPCAIASGYLGAKYGALRVIKIFIAAYVGICLFAFQLDKAWEFWLLAVVVGMCQGGIQSLSRSHFGKLVPKEESNEYYGFFDIFGKFADFFGPLMVGFCATAFGRSSYGVLGLIVLFIAGYALILCSERAAPAPAQSESV